MKFLINNLVPLAAALVCFLTLNTYAKSPIKVHVSILPQKYFVERIGGDRVRVDVLVKPGKSPATYSPTPAQIQKLTSSDLFFRIGVPFENGILQKIESICRAKIVDTRQGIVFRKMDNRHPVNEDHDHETKTRDHKNLFGNDPHIWMSPVIVKTQAHTIFKVLSHIDPEGKDEYKRNCELFVKDLDDLNNRLKMAFKDLKGKSLLVFHPSFGYFTDAYGLKQVSVETMGKAPKGKALSKIIKSAKEQKIRVVFVQAQFDGNTARKIASAIKGAVVSIDPLAYDYLANLENIALTIVETLKNTDHYAQ